VGWLPIHWLAPQSFRNDPCNQIMRSRVQTEKKQRLNSYKVEIVRWWVHDSQPFGSYSCCILRRNPNPLSQYIVRTEAKNRGSATYITTVSFDRLTWWANAISTEFVFLASICFLNNTEPAFPHNRCLPNASQRIMWRLRERIQSLLQGFPTPSQVCLCLWIFCVAVDIQFVSAGTKQCWWQCSRHWGNKGGSKVGSGSRGKSKLTSWWLVGESLPRDGLGTSNMFWVRRGYNGSVSRGVNFLGYL